MQSLYFPYCYFHFREFDFLKKYGKVWTGLLPFAWFHFIHEYKPDELLLMGGETASDKAFNNKTAKIKNSLK